MRLYSVIIFVAFSMAACPAQAAFLINSAIVEFTATGPRQQDIEIISRSKESDYIVSEVTEVIHAGLPDEKRRLIDDPATGGLLVTPNKTVLSGGGHKIVRFVLLKGPDASEHIYRVAIKPVIRGVETSDKLGLKVLVGYEVLVIVRPLVPAASYSAARHGKKFVVTNTGNTNVIFQSGWQCKQEEKCPVPPVVRAYAGQKVEMDLPFDKPITYSIWDGVAPIEKRFE